MKIYIDGKETAADDPTLQEAEKMEIESGLHYMAQGLARVIYGAATRKHGLSNRKIEIVR